MLPIDTGDQWHHFIFRPIVTVRVADQNLFLSVQLKLQLRVAALHSLLWEEAKRVFLFVHLQERCSVGLQDVQFDSDTYVKLPIHCHEGTYVVRILRIQMPFAEAGMDDLVESFERTNVLPNQLQSRPNCPQVSPVPPGWWGTAPTNRHDA